MAWSLIGNIKGPTGATGARGSNWTTSNANPVTPGEIEGDQHLNSTTGDVFEWTGATWAPRGSIQGPAGAPGAAGSPGAKWFTGTGAPSTPGSNAGDLYLETDLGDVFEWNGTSWGPVGNLAGPTGPQGDIGPTGLTGADGADGADGLSAYEVAVANGFVGSEGAWLASLKGDPGTPGTPGAAGADGASAYQVAVANGFIGDEAAWLASLVGDPGPAGPPGDPNLLADIAFTGSASDLVAGTIPDARLPGRLQAAGSLIGTTFVLDATSSAGFYRVSAGASPTGAEGTLLVVQGGPPSAVSQLFTDSVTHRLYSRYRLGLELWSDWQRIAFLDIARWVTEEAERVTTEDGEGLSFVTGVK